MSNMRRHARVHGQPRFTGEEAEAGDVGDADEPEAEGSPTTAMGSPALEPAGSPSSPSPPPPHPPPHPHPPQTGTAVDPIVPRTRTASSPSRSAARGGAPSSVGRPRSPRATRSRATRRSIGGPLPFQEPSMETIGLLRPSSPSPSLFPSSPVSLSPRHAAARVLVPASATPALSLAVTAHQLYEEAQHERDRAASPFPTRERERGLSIASAGPGPTSMAAPSPASTSGIDTHMPPVTTEESSTSTTADPTSATAGASGTRTSPRAKRAISPESPDNPKGHKRARSNPETMDPGGRGGRGGGGGSSRGRRGGGSPSSKKV